MSAISSPKNSCYYGNLKNMNLLCHTLKDSSESQVQNLINGYILNIPSLKNVNVTKCIIIINIQIGMEDT